MRKARSHARARAHLHTRCRAMAIAASRGVSKQRGGRVELGQTGQRKRQARERAESELASWERSRPTGSDHEHVAQQANKQGRTARCIKSKQAASAARPIGPRARGREEATSSTTAVTSKQTSGEKIKEQWSTCIVNRYKYTFVRLPFLLILCFRIPS